MRAFVLFLLLLLLSCSLPASAEYQARVVRDTALYKEESAAGAYGSIPEGTTVGVLAILEDAVRVRFGRNEGYLRKDALAMDCAQLEALGSVSMLGRSLYALREVQLPGVSGQSKMLRPGDEVLLLALAGDYAQVKQVSRSGLVPLDALALDEELCYVLGLPGDSIRDMEARLEDLGHFDGMPDDVLDIGTAEAVIRLRVQAGLGDLFLIDEDFEALLYGRDAPRHPICLGHLEPGDAGSPVSRLQNRLIAKGYLEAFPSGCYDNLVCQAVMLYQQMEGLPQTGTADQRTLSRLFSGAARTLPRNLIPVSRASSPYLPGGVVSLEWFEGGIQEIFPVGAIAQVTDIATGITWQTMRRGGINHADVQPLTKEDTAAFKRAAGDEWSWERRAIWVTVDGVRYGASMNCMPHGQGAIKDNNFPGHHCIHFPGSRTHKSNRLDEWHQACAALASEADPTNIENIDWDAFYLQQEIEREGKDYMEE